jgi:hypothetical protein
MHVKAQALAGGEREDEDKDQEEEEDGEGDSNKEKGADYGGVSSSSHSSHADSHDHPVYSVSRMTTSLSLSVRELSILRRSSSGGVLVMARLCTPARRWTWMFFLACSRRGLNLV